MFKLTWNYDENDETIKIEYSSEFKEVVEEHKWSDTDVILLHDDDNNRVVVFQCPVSLEVFMSYESRTYAIINKEKKTIEALLQYDDFVHLSQLFS